MSRNSSSVHKALKEMYDSKQFAELDPYRNPDSWKVMSPDERELLAKLFALQGEGLLKEGDKKGLKSFDLAVKASPKCHEILYQKGKAYASQSENVRSLKIASKSFEQATLLESRHFDSWFYWGHTLLDLGKKTEDAAYFYEADEKFNEAEKYIDQDFHNQQAAFYWHWGQGWFAAGRMSGEAVELSKSLEKFNKASELGCTEGQFWSDYGNALAEQAILLGRHELLFQVADMYRKSLEVDQEKFEVWLHFGCCMIRLYEMNCDEEYFEEGCEAFEAAAQLENKSSVLWGCWGLLLLNSGKYNRDVERLNAAVEKIIKAYECDPNDSLLLCRWAEALIHKGGIEENYEILCDAENKISECLAFDERNVEGWLQYGRCYTEIGRYFKDEQYYWEAVEKYELGLTIEPGNASIIYGLAIVYNELFEIIQSLPCLKEALGYFQSLSEQLEDPPPQVWLDWGNCLLRYGEHLQDREIVEQAVEKIEFALLLLDGALENDPTVIEALYQYGCVLDALGDYYDDPSYYEKAIQLFLNVLRVDPSMTTVRYHLGLALAHLGELMSDVDCLNNACEQFSFLLELDSEDELAWNDWGITLINLAQLVHDPCQPDLAGQYFVQAEEKLLRALSLGNVQANYMMACYCSLVHNYAASLLYLEKAKAAGALPPLDDIIHDDWLAGLRETHEFRLFMERVMREEKEKF